MIVRKTDANHKDILTFLHHIPALSVFSAHSIGKGFPDIVVGYKGLNYLFEIKDGKKSKSQKQLTEAQKEFHKYWCGQITVVENINEILFILGINN
jgi:hypothetical protein